MITRIIPQLVILIIISSNANSFKYKINLDRCKGVNKDTACFVRDSCFDRADVNAGKSDALTQYSADNDKLKNDTCDVIMQIKPFSRTKWHVMFEVTSDSEGLDSTWGMIFEQNKVLFESKTETTSEGRLKINKFGEQNYNATRLFCSIIIEEKSGERIVALFEHDDYNNHKPTLKYKTNEDQDPIKSIMFGSAGDILWALSQTNMKCDPSNVQSGKNATSEYLLHEVDTTQAEIKCSNKDHYLLIRDNKIIAYPVNEISCENKRFKYKKKDDPNEYVEISSDSTVPVEVYCAEKFCTLCSPLNCVDCADEEKDENECKIRKCANGKKWTQPDGGIVDGRIECKRSEKNPTTAAWFLNINTNLSVLAQDETLKCSDKFVCDTYSKLDLSCKEREDCEKANYSHDNKSILCTEGYDLKYNGAVLASTLNCNDTNGLFSDGNTTVDRERNVFCQKRSVEIAAAAAAMSTGSKIGIGLGVAGIIVVIVSILVFCVIRRRRSSPKTSPKSLNHSEGVKTALYAHSRESSNAPSGSECPPSTDLPKEKMSDSRDEKEKNEEKKDEKKEEKSEIKKEEKREEKKDEKKVEVKVEKEEKKEVKEEKKAEKKKPKKIVMDMTPKKAFPSLKQVERELKQMEGHEPANMAETGKKANAMDVTPEEIRIANKPGDIIKHWNDNIFEETLIKIVPIMSTENRMNFMSKLTAFNHYGGVKMYAECGTLSQFFRIVRQCQEKELDCPPTWELINRTVKVLCAHLPPKEGADVINRLRKMLRECGHTMLNVTTSKGKLGYARAINGDTPEMMIRRELAMRILLGVEDPECLEELRSMGDKLEEVDVSIQSVVFSHALNRMGKKEELEKRLNKDLKQEDPRPKDRPLGTEKQHLVYALASTNDETEMVNFVSKIADARGKASPPAEFNPTDLLWAYRGAIDNPAHIEKVLKVFEDKMDPNCDELVDEIVEQYGKTADEKKKLTNAMKADYLEICVLLAENCISQVQFKTLYDSSCAYIMYAGGGSRGFDSEKLMARAVNLGTILKDKKAVQLVDEGMKKAGY